MYYVYYFIFLIKAFLMLAKDIKAKTVKHNVSSRNMQ